MKKSRVFGSPIGLGLLLLSSLILLSLPQFAAASDATKPPMAFRDRLYDVAFISDNEAVAVGYPGKVFRTSDAGKTWELMPIDTREPLFAVDFVDSKIGWIAGRKGLLFQTTDGGKTWAKVNSGTEEYLFDVDFVDAEHGMAVGNFGVVIVTGDGGKTWTQNSLSVMNSATIYAVKMFDAQTAYIAGEYPIWEAELEAIPADKLSGFFKTKDGGNTWERVALPDASHIFAMSFRDPGHGYVAGTKGLLLSTDDGCATWKKIETGTQSHILMLKQAGDAQFGAGNAGAMIRLEKGQVSLPNSRAFFWFSAVDFNSKGQGIVVGDHGLVMTSEDAGKTWMPRE